MAQKFIVAIGYSEGGLSPLLTFFDHVPHDQATYIILRHIPQNQRGVLQEILNKHSKLRILEAVNGVPIENDVVYIPPSLSYITIKNDNLYLHQRARNTTPYNCSIDIFFKSMAEAKAKKSIAVILSGSGIDGTVGASQVHEAGGLVLVQSPKSCAYSEMAVSSINTGDVDEILSASEMPGFILKHINPILKTANEIERLKGRNL